MARSKILASAAATPSKASGRGKKRRGDEEGEVQSKKRRVDHVFKVLFNSNPKAYDRFESSYEGKKVMKGRVYDFHTLGDYPGNVDLEVTKWLIAQGWKDLFSYQGLTFPRLVQVLMTNYSPTTGRSWIGKTEIDLRPQSIRETLGLEFNEEEEEFEWPRKEILFNDLAKRQLTRPYVYLPSHYLGIDLKIAHNVIFNMIYPKRGSSDQVPEKDARILWALERGKKLDLAQIMSDHLAFVKSNSKAALPYGMYFTKFFMKHHIDVTKEPADYFRDSDIINLTTVRRMGFTLRGAVWSKKSRKQDTPPPSETEEEAEREVREEEGREEEEEGREARDATLEEVMRAVEEHLPTEAETTATPAEPQPTDHSPPSRPTRPARPARQPSQPTLDLTNLQNFITTSITKLESAFTNQIHTLSQRVDNLESTLNFKLDTLITLVESQHPAPPPDPFKAKMKGIVIHDQSQSSSSQSYHPIARSPPKPFQEPSTHHQPIPSPQPSMHDHLSSEHTPSIHASQTTPQPSPHSQAQPTPKTSPQPTSQPTPQPTQALSQATVESTTSQQSTHPPSQLPDTQPIPEPEPSFDPNLAMVVYQPPQTIEPPEEVGESQTPLPQPQPASPASSSKTISETPKPNQPIDIDSDTTPPAPLSSDSSDTPNFPTIAPLQTQKAPEPEPDLNRPIITIDLAEFNRRSLENRRAIDLNLKYIAAGVQCREPYPYPELMDPNSHKYLRVISSSRYPTPMIDSVLHPPSTESPARPLPIKQKHALAKPSTSSHILYPAPTNPPQPTPEPSPPTQPARPPAHAQPTQPDPPPSTQPTTFTLQRQPQPISPYPISYIRRLPKHLPKQPPPPPPEGS